jgi:hypothetical protein
MNPAALLLVLLSLGGLLLGRRRGLGLAWLVCGLAATALLAPALAIPDGVPSPAASLAHDPPWQGIADPAAGNDNLRDVTYQVEPWLLFLRHELRAGRLPLWNPHQSAGCPYWSNGSSAPLFPLHLLFVLLPPRLGLLLLPWLRLVLAGCGAWALAAELGLSRPAALLAAVIYPLSGTVTSFLLYPMSNAHALLPWIFLAVERLAAGGGAPAGAWAAARRAALGAAPLALLGGLQLMGGHPETAVYTALLTALYLLVRGSSRPLAAWSGLAAGWALAGAIAAVELLPLALTLPETSRWLAWKPPDPVPLRTVAGLLLRLVLPDLYGNPARGTWWGPFNFAATSIYAGAGALLLAAGGLARIFHPPPAATADQPASGLGYLFRSDPEATDDWSDSRLDARHDLDRDRHGNLPADRRADRPLDGRADLHLDRHGDLPLERRSDLPADRREGRRWDRRWLAVAAVTLFALCAAYQLPGARDLMLALPVVRRGLHHYIKLGLELGLALLAAAGLDGWLAGKRRALLAGAAFLLAALAAAWLRFGGGAGEWRAHGLLAGQAAWSAWSAAFALLLVAALRLAPAHRRRLAPLVIALFAADLVIAHAPTNPGLSLARLYPRTPAVRFLEGRPGRVAGTGGTLHPNAAMVYGLYDVRGDDSVKLERYEELYAAHLGPGHPTYFQPIDRWQGPWLDRLGVRWVMTGPREPPPAPGWRAGYAGADAQVFERPTALPLVRWLAPAGRSTGGGASIAPAGGAAVHAAAAGADPARGARPAAAAAVPAAVSAADSATPAAATPPPPVVVRRVPGAWDISFRTAAPATLEIAEVWDRGWSASLDGAPRPVEPVDGPLLGVRLAPGAGTLRLAYSPAGIGWGALISLFGLAVSSLLLLARTPLRPPAGTRARQHPPPAPHADRARRTEKDHRDR